jgi:hypothetical protein
VKKILTAGILCLLYYSTINAQGGIDIYGYVQSSFLTFHNHFEPYAPVGEDNYTYKNMGIDQLSVFFGKELGDDFSAFVNFEYSNNYSSDKGFGSFNLQEAYLKWDYRDFLKVKFGMVIPQFNSLFEIYNRTPLIPYLIKPKLYNTTAGNLVNIFNILPQKALIQANGSVPVESVNFEYALFMGNPPNSYISSPSNDMLPGYVPYGESAVNFISVGARIGIKTNFLRAGVSASMDKDNGRGFVKNSQGDIANIGDLNRYRLGADFYCKVWNFELNSEYLIVKDKIPSNVQDSLNLWNSLDPYFIGNGLDKKFYYATLQYDFSDKLIGYVMYDFLNDDINPYYFGLDGYYGYHLGAAYYMNDNILLKVQYNKNFGRFDTGEEVIPIRNYFEDVFSLGASYNF